MYYLHYLRFNLDERKTLTKISTRKPLTTVPQTSARFGHEGTRKPANSNLTAKSSLQGYEPSSVTGHEPIVMTISTGGAKVHNPNDTHSQVDSAHGSKKRSSSSESSHETSAVDSTKRRKSIRKNQLASLWPQGSFLSPCVNLQAPWSRIIVGC